MGEDAGYEIRLKGHLDGRWAAWFEGLTLSHADDGTTVLVASGDVVEEVRSCGRRLRAPGRSALDVP